jgi:hypothetical protein
MTPERMAAVDPRYEQAAARSLSRHLRSLILVMAPIMVCVTLVAAAFTTVVHFVQLSVAWHISSPTFAGYSSIFGWKWPSTFYAIDIAAWDIFFGLALLFAVPAFADRADAIWVRRSLLLSGSMCLIGPFANMLGLRTIGIVGYTIVFRPHLPPAQPYVPGHGTSCCDVRRWPVEIATGRAPGPVFRDDPRGLPCPLGGEIRPGSGCFEIRG